MIIVLVTISNIYLHLVGLEYLDFHIYKIKGCFTFLSCCLLGIIHGSLFYIKPSYVGLYGGEE